MFTQPAKPAASSKPASPASAAKAANRPINVSTAPIAKKNFGFDEARHLLWRAGFGGTPEQVNLLVQWGPERSVDHLVNYEQVKVDPVTPDLFKNSIIREPTDSERMMYRQALQARDENKLAETRVMRQQAEQNDREQMKQLQRWWLKRMIETPRPLEEKMTLFWHGLLATSYRTIEDSYHLFMQNQLYRKHAVGSYADLLHALIRDPAMLKYLNNNESRKNKPNENLAREIMELFSLGAGNYTEDDIKQGAKALTGYTFKDDEFVFDQKNHDTGGKTILGRSGNMNGDQFVDIILAQPACSQYLATRLYKFFVHDYPSGIAKIDSAASQVIREMASELSGRNYQIAPVLRKLLLSQHFYDPALRGEQIKSPVQLVVGAVRSLNTPVRDLYAVLSGMRFMGQEIFYPPSVKGWDGGRAWVNTATMFIRANMLVFLLTGRRPQGIDAMASTEVWDAQALVQQISAVFPAQGSGEASEVLDSVLRFAIGRTDPASREVLEQFLAARGNTLNATNLTELMLLITAMPEYQLC